MSQYARPNGDQENQWSSGGFGDINEAIRDDGDFANTQDNPNPGSGSSGFLRVHLSAISAPDTGDVTIRWATALIDGGVVAGSAGTGCDVTMELVEGASTVRATMRSAEALDAELAWTGDSYILSGAEKSSIGNWGDLDIIIDMDGGGGSPTNRRGGGISWLELEAPDAPAVGVGIPLVMHHRKQMAGN